MTRADCAFPGCANSAMAPFAILRVMLLIEPTRRYASAAIAVFLASDESRMLTGTTLAADGGRPSCLRVCAGG